MTPLVPLTNHAPIGPSNPVYMAIIYVAVALIAAFGIGLVWFLDGAVNGD